MTNWTDVLGDPSYSMVDRANAMLDGLENYLLCLQMDNEAEEVRAIPRVREGSTPLRGYGKYLQGMSDTLNFQSIDPFNSLPRDFRMNNRTELRFSDEQRSSQYEIAYHFLPDRGVWKLWGAFIAAHHMYMVRKKHEELGTA